MDLQRIDLNLLVAFEALMAERRVSSAATRLGSSQPAMSAALSRLRTLFEDQILVRSGRDMLPTQRAIQLEAEIAKALAQIRTALEPQAPFDPARSRRVFHLSGGDYASMVILPPLVGYLAQYAPGIDVRLRFVEKDHAYDLLDGDRLDLALGVFPEPPKRMGLQALFDEHFVCVARRDHPGLQATLTTSVFAQLPHLLVTERGDVVGAVDEALAREGLQRRVALTVPHVLVVAAVVMGGDLVATIGSRAATLFAENGGLSVHELPLTMPKWRMSMMWSRQKSNDPGLLWLRSVLATISAGV